jgi:hypothetical protein
MTQYIDLLAALDSRGHRDTVHFAADIGHALGSDRSRFGDKPFELVYGPHDGRMLRIKATVPDNLSFEALQRYLLSLKFRYLRNDDVAVLLGYVESGGADMWMITFAARRGRGFLRVTIARETITFG